MRISTILHSEYTGQARVVFRNSIHLEGSFKLQLYTGGTCRLTLTIELPKQLEQFRLLHEVTRADMQDRSVERKNFEASISGKCSDGGEMEADWLSLENTHVDINKTDAKAILDPRTGGFVFDVFEAIKSATILEGHASLEFIVASEVKIKYSEISPSANIS